MNHKIKNSANLSKILSRLRSKGEKIVFTNGCFDIIHRGHVEYLNKAKKLGDVLVIGLNSDLSVRLIKGKGRPINNEDDRAEVLAALYFVDYITKFDELTPEDLIRRVMPDVLVKGGDWKAQDIVGSDIVKSYGGKVARIPFVKGYSTSSLVKKISKYGEKRNISSDRRKL